MELAEASSFCKTFKGAALSCLILMWAVRHSRRNFTRDDLARLTGYSRPTVADGLTQLEMQGLAFRVSRYQWQLTDQGFQLSLDQAGSQNFLLGESKNLTPVVLDKNHVHEPIDLHEQQVPLPSGVKKFDSDPLRETTFEGLAQELVTCGCSPLTAREAIVEALGQETSAKELELRILWWRVYCLAHPKIGHAGNLIAARVAKGIDKPKDFGIRDIPDRFYELGQEIEDLERELESARLNGTGQPQER